jgi:hypothetical protein
MDVPTLCDDTFYRENALRKTLNTHQGNPKGLFFKPSMSDKATPNTAVRAELRLGDNVRLSLFTILFVFY